MDGRPKNARNGRESRGRVDRMKRILDVAQDISCCIDMIAGIDADDALAVAQFLHTYGDAAIPALDLTAREGAIFYDACRRLQLEAAAGR